MTEDKWYWRLRAWLLVKLAGKRQVIIGANIVMNNDDYAIKADNHDVIVNNNFLR